MDFRDNINQDIPKHPTALYALREPEKNPNEQQQANG